jgi:hypothetical protein
LSDPNDSFATGSLLAKIRIDLMTLNALGNFNPFALSSQGETNSTIYSDSSPPGGTYIERAYLQTPILGHPFSDVLTNVEISRSSI